MPSSITTQAPTGPLPNWCLANAWGFHGEPYKCGNDTTKPDDYWSVCCDGDIVNVKSNIWRIPRNMKMEELICCRHIGSLEGGLHPLPAGPPWTCDLGAVGTPLASLAATNANNAGAFVATYASANYEFGPTPTDMLMTETPQCLWVNTKESVAMREVTVDAANIVRLSTTMFPGGAYGDDVETATVVTTPLFPSKSSTSKVRSTATGDESSSITNALFPSPTTGRSVFPTTASAHTTTGAGSNLRESSLSRAVLISMMASLIMAIIS